jgi:hypothetical protein
MARSRNRAVQSAPRQAGEQNCTYAIAPPSGLVGGKTGTSGFTNEVILGVRVGYDNLIATPYARARPGRRTSGGGSRSSQATWAC